MTGIGMSRLNAFCGIANAPQSIANRQGKEASCAKLMALGFPDWQKGRSCLFPPAEKVSFFGYRKGSFVCAIEHGSAGPAASNGVKLARLQSRCGLTTERTAEPQSYQRAKRPRGFESIDQALLWMAARPKCGRREKELLQKSRI
jgi:hypothetical protein